ncbi:MAG TPA: hypothetical protein VMG81_06720 [Thermoplasmata archaeon]|nr:hypothetical protein [Thermoplasmata archaeon]
MVDGRLDLGVAQVQRLLDNQLSSVDTIQTKIGVLLGFAATSLALIFSFGYSWVAAHGWLATGSAAALLASTAIFGASLMLTDYQIAPEPSWRVKLLNDADVKADELKEQVIGAMWKAYDTNRTLIDSRFGVVNIAVVLLVVGLGILVGGVLAQ